MSQNYFCCVRVSLQYSTSIAKISKFPFQNCNFKIVVYSIMKNILLFTQNYRLEGKFRLSHFLDPSLKIVFFLSPLSSFSLPFLLPLSVLCWNTQDWLFSSYHLHYGEICCSTQLKREIVEGRNLLHSQINEKRNYLPAKVRKFCKLF